VMMESESKIDISEPEMADISPPSTTAIASTTSEIPNDKVDNEDVFLRTTSEGFGDEYEVIKTYAPEVFPLSPVIFADNMQNSAVCLNEWDEVTITIPSEVNNLLLKPVNNVNGRLLLRTVSETDRSVALVKTFDIYAVEEDKSATYTYRWQYGQSDSNFVFTPDDLHRYQVSFGFPYLSERVQDEEVTGSGIGYQDFNIETEPFVVRECGS